MFSSGTALRSICILVAMLACLTTPAYSQLIVAHRGASHDAPENTLAAFQLAFDKDADGIEGDFRLTKDGQIVCIHDEDTQRVSTKNLVVADSTLDELRQIDVGGWKGKQWKGERIPTLSEVMNVVPSGKHFFIELKCGPEIIKPLQRVLQESEADIENCIVISFNSQTIKACRKTMPERQCQWLTGYKLKQEEGKDAWTPSQATVLESLQGCDADGLGCKANTAAFTAEMIDFLRANGFPTFHVWTVDDAPTARHYQKLGAFGITTNRPRFIRDALER